MNKTIEIRQKNKQKYSNEFQTGLQNYKELKNSITFL